MTHFLSRYPAVDAPIRSSDLNFALQDPQGLVLSRVFGLVPALSWSRACSAGSWTHENLRADVDPDIADADKYLSGKLLLHSHELEEAAEHLNLSEDATTLLLEKEIKTFDCAKAWWRVVRDQNVMLPGTGELVGVMEWLSRFQWLCSEHRFLVRNISTPGFLIDCLAQPDVLLVDRKTGLLWILDLKTCDAKPSERMRTFPYEPQAQHYINVLDQALQKGADFKGDTPIDLSGLRLGGMVHLVVQKPTIEFGMKDRNYTLDESPFKSGPRKGQPRNERVYQGEPIFENYVKRVCEWYAGTGEYLHREQAECPIGLSVTHADPVLDRSGAIFRSYTNRLQRACDVMLDGSGAPEEAPCGSPVGLYGGTSTYLPFQVAKYEDWASVVESEGFVVRHRDPDLNNLNVEGCFCPPDRITALQEAA